MKEIRDSGIIVTKIHPPIGGEIRFAAKARIFYAGGEQGSLHEHHGKTELEARSKAKQELDTFLKKNQG